MRQEAPEWFDPRMGVDFIFNVNKSPSVPATVTFREVVFLEYLGNPSIEPVLPLPIH